MIPIGYIAMRHGVRLTRPVQAYTRWLDQIPAEFRKSVLGETLGARALPKIEQDPYCLAMLNKPIFFLRAADRAIGAHANAVQLAYSDFMALAQELARRIDLPLPGWH